MKWCVNVFGCGKLLFLDKLVVKFISVIAVISLPSPHRIRELFDIFHGLRVLHPDVAITLAFLNSTSKLGLFFIGRNFNFCRISVAK